MTPESLRQQIAEKEFEYFIFKYKLPERQEKELRDIVKLLLAAQQTATRIEAYQDVNRWIAEEYKKLDGSKYPLDAAKVSEQISQALSKLRKEL